MGRSAVAEKPADDIVVEQAPEADQGEYEVIYRRFRPTKFSRVVGQLHATEPLRRAVAANKVPHALMFCGPRGCGKTTTARILAMALNCDNVTDGEPCGECTMCAGVASGTASIGVTEVDAASNRSIDGVRSLIESMNTGSIARRRVYIIDEAHQLTKEAATALLKTLEEPPEGVVIILATTDPEKMLPTILSRTTVFKFRTVEPDTMVDLISKVAEADGLSLTEEQISSVVVEGRGSPRDTLSVLERVASGAEISSSTIAADVTKALADDNVSDLLVSIADAINEGSDPITIASSLMSHWRDCLLAVQAPALLQLPKVALERARSDGKSLGSRKMIGLLNHVADASARMRMAGDPRLVLEVALIQTVVPDAKDGADALHDRFSDIEDMIEELGEKIAAIRVAAPGADNDWPPAPERPDRVAQSDDEDAPESADDDEDVRDDAGEQDDEPETPANDSEDDLEGDESADDDQEEEAPRKKQAQSADDLLDDLFDKASKRLQRSLSDASGELKGNTLVVITADDLSDRAYDQLRDLVEDAGYELDHQVEDE